MGVACRARRIRGGSRPVQCLELSFASTGKDYKLFSSLYRSLRNRGVEFKDESKVDIFTPNLSDEVASSVPSGMHVRRRDWSEVTKGYTSPNAKLENDLHIVQQHMVKMQGFGERNRRNCIPEKKQQVRMGGER